MTMSTTTLEENGNFLDNQENPADLELCLKDSFQFQQDLEDTLSISSGNPCPIKDAQNNNETMDNTPSEGLSDQALDNLRIFTHLHRTSPLESIRELVQLEETSDSRSPGDGAVRIKDVCNEMSPSTSIECVALFSEGCGAGLETTALEQVSSTQLDAVDVCSSVDDGSCPPENPLFSALISGQPEWGYSVVSHNQKEIAGHQFSSSHTSFEVPMENQSNIMPLQDLQEETVCSPIGVNSNISEEAENNNPSLEAADAYRCEMEASVDNQTLIEVLTACEARVEQLEELKSSSIEMSAQLQSTRSLAARLHQEVLNLEHKCHLKDKELHDLKVNLEKTSVALQTRNAEMAAVTEELQRLHLELDVQKKTAAAGRTVSANGQLAPNAHQRNGSSKVCTLF